MVPEDSPTIDRNRFPSVRKVVVAALRSGRRTVPVHGLIQLDVTDVRNRLADPPLSFTAFIVASVGRAAAAHPAVHAYRDWRGRLVTHRHVDVATIIEVATPEGPFPLGHMFRDTDTRTVADLTAEMRAAQHDPESAQRALWARLVPFASRVPGLLWLMFSAMRRSVAARRRIGTVAVTAVGMFGEGGGSGIPAMTTMSLSVLVGGISRRPWVVDGDIQVREILELTITVDHNVVDGAPATRFTSDLRRIIEGGEVLS